MLTAFNVRRKKGFNKEHGTSNLCADHPGGTRLKAAVLELLCYDSDILKYPKTKQQKCNTWKWQWGSFPYYYERYLWIVGCKPQILTALLSVCRGHTAQSLWHSPWLQLSTGAQRVLNLKPGSRRTVLICLMLHNACDYLVRRWREISILQDPRKNVFSLHATCV